MINELDKLSVPQFVGKNVYNRYDPDTMLNILKAVATTKDTVNVICDRFGVKENTVYWWRALSDDILKAWKHAMYLRTHILADQIEEEGVKLDQDCDDSSKDPREQTVKIKRYDVRTRHRQWFMSRVNRQDYGDNVQIESNVTITAAETRENAWNKAREVQDAIYTDVSPVKTVNRSVNKEDISPDT